MKICGIARDDGACAYYRIIIPVEYVSVYDKEVYREIVKPGDMAERVALKMDADVVVIARPNSESWLHKIRTLKKLGKAVVVDYDDNVFSVSPFSPHYAEFGTREVKVTMADGTEMLLWADTVNLNGEKHCDMKANADRLEWTKLCIHEADMVTATTEILTDIYRNYNSNAKAMPNCVDLKYWKTADIRKDRIRLCWHGGYSHYEDMFILRDVLPEIMDRYSNVDFVCYGHYFKTALDKCPKERVIYEQWVPTTAHPFKLAVLGIDIGIIPLDDNEFNRCKSCIKWVEYGALGIPCVTSYVSPYKEVYDGKNGIFVENDTNAWIKAISTLLDDPLLRADMGRRARQTVERDWDIHTQYWRWLNAYKALVG